LEEIDLPMHILIGYRQFSALIKGGYISAWPIFGMGRTRRKNEKPILYFSLNPQISGHY
jgi:hypothetical protein